MIKLYIANLGAYNRGHLIGKWIELPMDEEDLQAEIDEVLNGEEAQKTQSEYDIDEEIAIHDYETDFDLKIGEYDSITELNELAEKLEELDEHDQTKLKALLEYDSYYFKDITDTIDRLDEVYLYEDVNNEEDLGYYVVDNGLFGVDIPESLSSYIDYEAVGRDWNLNCSGGFTSYGWLEITF